MGIMGLACVRVLRVMMHEVIRSGFCFGSNYKSLPIMVVDTAIEGQQTEAASGRGKGGPEARKADDNGRVPYPNIAITAENSIGVKPFSPNKLTTSHC